MQNASNINKQAKGRNWWETGAAGFTLLPSKVCLYRYLVKVSRPFAGFQAAVRSTTMIDCLPDQSHCNWMLFKKAFTRLSVSSGSLVAWLMFAKQEARGVVLSTPMH
jgi:hypothetical protein